MTNSNTATNANTNRDMTNSSSNDDEQNAMAAGQTNIARESGHHGSNIGAAQSSTLSSDNRLRFRLGHAQPCPLNYTPGLNHGGQGTGIITHPSDEGQPLEIIYTLSSSIEIYHPPPRESEGVEDTHPPDMPIPVILHNIHRDILPVMGDENNNSQVDASAHNNPGATSNLISHHEPHGQAIIGNNTMTITPMEHSHDTDFSVDTFDPHSDNQSDADSEEDEQRFVPENVHTIDSDNDLTHTSEGQASPNADVVNVNNDNSTWSNQTNIISDQPIATNSSSPEAFDNERNVNTTIGGVYQSGLHVIPTSNIFMPKERSPADSGDESSGENTR